MGIYIQAETDMESYPTTKQELLYQNLMVIKDHFAAKKFKVQELDNSLLISGFRAVVIKATLEKLINEDLITKGRVISFDNYVLYTPTGKIKFLDLNFKL